MTFFSHFKQRDFFILVAVYLIAWAWFNDYWVCFFCDGIYVSGLYFIEQWRNANYENSLENSAEIDEQKYQQRTKEIGMIYLLLCGLFSYKSAGWLIGSQQSKAKTVCGAVTERHVSHARRKLRLFATLSYIRVASENKSYQFEGADFSIEKFTVGNQVCVNFIDKNTSIFLPKHHINSMTKQ